MSIRIIAGLGNPGLEYRDTRHNVGFIEVDTLAAHTGVEWSFKKHFEALVAKAQIANRLVLLIKPWAFMNNSGQSLASLCGYFKVAEAEVVVVHDDITLALGQMKIAVSGSSGGHNGVTSVIGHLGADFIRFKIGIGSKSLPQMSLTDHVLGKFSPLERSLIETRKDEFLKGIELLVDKGPVPAMNLINQRLRNNESKQ